MHFYAEKYVSMLSSLTGSYKLLTIYTQVFIKICLCHFHIYGHILHLQPESNDAITMCITCKAATLFTCLGGFTSLWKSVPNWHYIYTQNCP